jgi:hypothetical protein
VKTASEFFRELLPWLNSGRAELTDDRRLTNQFAGLERRRTRGGRETIDRPPGGHNDIANAAALALMKAASEGAPALWHRRDLVSANGSGVLMPAECTVILAALAPGGDGRAAVAYWGAVAPRGARDLVNQGVAPVARELVLLDIETLPVAPSAFDRVRVRLRELVRLTQGWAAASYVPAALVGHAWACGLPAEAIEPLLPDEIPSLALSAAVHIAAGRVKVSREALAKSDVLPLGGLLDARGDDTDPVRIACLQGIAIALGSGGMTR